MNVKFKYLIGFLSIVALALVSSPHVSTAQGIGGYGGGGFGGYGGGGFGGPGFGGGAGGIGQGAVTVKYGEIIYDAVFGDLIDYNVYYIQVPQDTIGVHYYDDGTTNNDEVGYDGIPSNITINRDTYLGPFSIKYKNHLSNAVQVAKNMGAFEFYDMDVVTESEDSSIPQLNEAQDQMESVIDGLQSRLAQFEGYNDERFVKAVDPTLFEAQEGVGAFGGGITTGPGGSLQLPDLPPPPGLPEYNIRGERIDEGAEGSPQAPQGPQGGQTGQEGGQFSPVGRAQGAVQAMEGLNALNSP